MLAHWWAGDIYSLRVALEGGKGPGIQVQALGVCPGTGFAAQDPYCAANQTVLQMMAREVGAAKPPRSRHVSPLGRAVLVGPL